MIAILTGVRWYLLVIQSAFLWWLMMLNIFSCVWSPSVYLLWKNVSSSFLSIFLIKLLFFWGGYYIVWAVYMVEILTPHWSYYLQKYFLPFSRLSFHFVCGFLCCAKAFKSNCVPFIYFCFCFLCLMRQIQKNIAMIYVREYSACVFLLEFLWFLLLHLGF